MEESDERGAQRAKSLEQEGRHSLILYRQGSGCLHPEALMKMHTPKPYPRMRGSNPSPINIWGLNSLLWKLFYAIERVWPHPWPLPSSKPDPAPSLGQPIISRHRSRSLRGRAKSPCHLRTNALDLLTQKLQDQSLGSLCFEQLSVLLTLVRELLLKKSLCSFGMRHMQYR